jgi:hypothetical protein
VIGIDVSPNYSNNNNYNASVSKNLITNLRSNNVSAVNGSVTGIYLNQGNDNNSSQVNATITKNEVKNLFSGSLGTTTLVVSISNNCRFTNMIIDSNKISNLSTFSTSPGQHQTASVQGINSIYSSNAPLSITGNIVFNLENRSTNVDVSTYTIGINCFPANSNLTIAKNKVFDLRNSTSKGVVAGMALRGVGGSGSFSVSNNMVSLNPDNVNVYGILNDVNAAKINLYYNSIAIGGTGNNSSAAFFRGSTANTTIESLNNIFYNSRTGGDANRYTIINANPNPLTGWTNSNYNNFYNGNPAKAILWNNLPLNLADYKRLSSQDQCSVSSDVQFIKRDSADMHLRDVASNQTLAGISIQAVTTDIDGDARHLVPSMGADEKIISFKVPSITASGAITFCQGNMVTLIASLTSGIQWYKDGVAINGAVSQTYQVNQTGSYSTQLSDACQPLKSNSITVTVNPIPLAPATSATGATTFCSGGSVVLRSSAPSNNQWYKDGVALTGEVNQTFSARQNGLYSVATMINGCMSAPSSSTEVIVNPIPLAPAISQIGKVLISSSASGNQWFLNGIAIVGAINQQHTPTEEGIYTVQVTTKGCVSAFSVLYSFIKTIVVFPNPARDILKIRITGYSERISYILYDAIGRKLTKQSEDVISPSNIDINIQTLAAGAYTIVIVTSDGLITKSVLKQ